MSYTPKSEREEPTEEMLGSAEENIETLEKELDNEQTDYEKFTEKMIEELERL